MGNNHTSNISRAMPGVPQPIQSQNGTTSSRFPEFTAVDAAHALCGMRVTTDVTPREAVHTTEDTSGQVRRMELHEFLRRIEVPPSNPGSRSRDGFEMPHVKRRRLNSLSRIINPPPTPSEGSPAPPSPVARPGTPRGRSPAPPSPAARPETPRGPSPAPPSPAAPPSLAARPSPEPRPSPAARPSHAARTSPAPRPSLASRPAPASGLETPSGPSPRVCVYNENCNIGPDSTRKGVSHFFGRNKKETLKIPNECWPVICRRHYQRMRYRKDKLKCFYEVQLETIAWALEGMEEHMSPINWTIQYQKGLQERLNADNSKFRQTHGKLKTSAAPSPDKLDAKARELALARELESRTGTNKTTDDVKDFLALMEEACMNGEVTNLIAVEFLPAQHRSFDPPQ